jgi:hypothetical protein
MWNNIDEFAEWYKSNRHPFKPQARDPLYITEHSISTIIFRKDRYQVELYYMKPNTTIPQVPAPGIEQQIIFLNGTISGSKDGTLVFDSTPVAEQTNEDGSNILYNKIFKLDDANLDIVEIGHKGACLMSIQKWDDGIEMTSLSRQRGLALN